MTLRERYTAALVARGWTRDYETRSTRYAVFWHTNVTGKRIYLGTHGAIRVGTTLATSRPMSPRGIDVLLGCTLDRHIAV